MNRPVYVILLFRLFCYVFRSNVSNVISSQNVFSIDLSIAHTHGNGHSLARSISMGTQPYGRLRRFAFFYYTWCRTICMWIPFGSDFFSHQFSTIEIDGILRIWGRILNILIAIYFASLFLFHSILQIIKRNKWGFFLVWTWIQSQIADRWRTSPLSLRLAFFSYSLKSIRVTVSDNALSQHEFSNKVELSKEMQICGRHLCWRCFF